MKFALPPCLLTPAARRRKRAAVAADRARLPPWPVARLHLPGRLVRVAVRAQHRVYAVPNNGGWYDFGYFLGIVVFGVGARKSVTTSTRAGSMSARRRRL